MGKDNLGYPKYFINKEPNSILINRKCIAWDSIESNAVECLCAMKSVNIDRKLKYECTDFNGKFIGNYRFVRLEKMAQTQTPELYAKDVFDFTHAKNFDKNVIVDSEFLNKVKEQSIYLVQSQIKHLPKFDGFDMYEMYLLKGALLELQESKEYVFK